MNNFLESIGNSILLYIIISTTLFIFIIYIIWCLIKSAITKGVQDGIYNAVVMLQNHGIITDIIDEMEETKQLFNPNNPPIED